MSNSNVLSYNIILSLIKDATRIYDFNFLIKKYRKFILESPRLINMLNERAAVFMENHSTPKEAQALYEILEELKEDSANRIEYLKMANIKPFDIMDQSTIESERNKSKLEIEKKREEIRSEKMAKYLASQEISEKEARLKESLREKETELKALNNKVRMEIKQRPKLVFAEFSEKLDIIINKLDKIEDDIQSIKSRSSTHHL